MFVNSHPVPNGTNNKIIERYITQMQGRNRAKERCNNKLLRRNYTDARGESESESESEPRGALNNKNLPRSGAKPRPDAGTV